MKGNPICSVNPIRAGVDVQDGRQNFNKIASLLGRWVSMRMYTPVTSRCV